MSGSIRIIRLPPPRCQHVRVELRIDVWTNGVGAMPAPMPMQRLGARLRDWRLREKVSLPEAARRFECAHSYLTKLEFGLRRPSMDGVAGKIAHDLNITQEERIAELFWWDVCDRPEGRTLAGSLIHQVLLDVFEVDTDYREVADDEIDEELARCRPGPASEQEAEELRAEIRAELGKELVIEGKIECFARWASSSFVAKCRNISESADPAEQLFVLSGEFCDPTRWPKALLVEFLLEFIENISFDFVHPLLPESDTKLRHGNHLRATLSTGASVTLPIRYWSASDTPEETENQDHPVSPPER